MSVDVGDAATEHPLALRPGTILDDRYRLLRLLAGTSCAVSYLAQDDRTSDLVVIEEFLPRALVTRQSSGTVRPHTPSDEVEFTRAAKRFAREGERLAEINHPNLLRVHRAFEANGTAYVVMSHREAVPLQGFVAAAGGRLSPAPATEFVRRLLEALDAMHAEGVFHRSLSPASVHVDAAGRPLLQSVSATRHLASQARDLVDGFAPIELYGSKGVGPWTDVYSASALLYYLLTGSAPTSAIDRAAGQILVAPTTIVGGLPPSLVAALMRGLAQLPEQRPHSASELARQLSSSGAAPAVAPITAAPMLTAAAASALSELAISEQSAPNAPQPSAAALPPDADRSSDLRLSAGVVIPAHDNLAGRVRKWLSAYRQRDDDHVLTAEEQAILDAASRLATGMASPSAAPLQPPPAPTMASALDGEPLARPVAQEIGSPDVQASSASAIDDASFIEPALEPESTFERGSLPLPASEQEPPRRHFELALPPFESATPALPDEPRLPADAPSDPLLLRAAPRISAFANKRTTRTLWSVGALMLLAAAVAGAAWAARSGTGTTPTERVAGNAPQPRLAGAPLAAPAVPDSAVRQIRNEAAGAIQQGASTAAVDSARNAFRSERPKTVARSESRPDSTAAVLAGLANVSVPIATPNDGPQLLPADVVIDIRDRLSQGRLLAEGGDYAGARRTFSAALKAIDAASAKYVSSDALRTLRRDVEKESQSALDACNAENEFRKRRDGKTLSCG